MSHVLLDAHVRPSPVLAPPAQMRAITKETHITKRRKISRCLVAALEQKEIRRMTAAAAARQLVCDCSDDIYKITGQ